eukprot:525460_1
MTAKKKPDGKKQKSGGKENKSSGKEKQSGGKFNLCSCKKSTDVRTETPASETPASMASTSAMNRVTRCPDPGMLSKHPHSFILRSSTHDADSPTHHLGKNRRASMPLWPVDRRNSTSNLDTAPRCRRYSNSSSGYTSIVELTNQANLQGKSEPFRASWMRRNCRRF